MGAKAVLLVDDTCALCNRSVFFIIKNGADDHYEFLSLYSAEGKNYLKKYKFPEGYNKSLVLIENNKAYIKSDAVLRISGNLNGLYSLLNLFRFIPVGIRDSIYGFVSKYRHHIIKYKCQF
jgi:predicted DCC family thiol-disulfide oxidoreductase YuxK